MKPRNMLLLSVAVLAAASATLALAQNRTNPEPKTTQDSQSDSSDSDRKAQRRARRWLKRFLDSQKLLGQVFAGGGIGLDENLLKDRIVLSLYQGLEACDH